MPLVKEKRNILDNLEYQEVLKTNIGFLQKQKSELDQQILLATVDLRNTRDSVNTMRQEFETFKTREMKKLNEEKITVNNFVINERESARILSAQIKKRSDDLSIREQANMRIEQERKDIANKVIEAEKLISQSKIEIANTQRARVQAESKMNVALGYLREANEKNAKTEAMNKDLVLREGKLLELSKDTEAKLKNIEEARKIVEPKIEEIKKIEANNVSLLEKIKKERSEIEIKVDEDKRIVAGLEERKARLDEKEREIITKQEEVTRKTLLLKDKK